MTETSRAQHVSSAGSVHSDDLSRQRVVAWGHEMRDVHRRLVDALDIARVAVEEGGRPESAAADLQVFCYGFCGALAGHHRSEDATLFPLLLARHPDVASTVHQLMQDHSMISHLIQGLEHALHTEADRATLLRHLDGIEAIMESHFRYEERQLVDLLDQLPVGELDRAALFGPPA
jgi:hemerythrin-like domain-containing protein